jgi:hypothetical protein
MFKIEGATDITMWIRLTNETGKHRGVQYHEGLVRDPLEWNTSRECCEGGIYFCKREHVLHWMRYLGEPMVWAWTVDIPDGARQRHYIFQSKSEAVVLSHRRPVAVIIAELTEDELIRAVSRDRAAIQYIPDPSEAVQLASVRSNPGSLKWISQPTARVVAAAQQ